MPIDTEELCAILSDDGRLSHIKPDFEQRDTQLAMLALVVQGFREGQIIIAEAGTGVGKSLAYLLPAIDWSHDERVVISTSTIPLQHQLYEKDIPLAMSALKCDKPYVLIKGRSNYVCPARVEEEIEEGILSAEDGDRLKLISDWIRQSETGDRSDAPIYPDTHLWARINADPHACSSQRCHMQADCFIARLRAKARKARLLIVNHHLLFSDLVIRMNSGERDREIILPPFRHVICDEAHAIEQSATSFFSRRLSRASVTQLAARLLRTHKKRRLGLVPKLERIIGPGSDSPIGEIAIAIDKMLEQTQTVDTHALNLVRNEATLRFIAANAGDYRSLFAATTEMADRMNETRRLLTRLLERVPEEERQSSPASEIDSLNRHLSGMEQNLRALPQFSEQRDRIFWIERYAPRSVPSAALMSAPLEIGSLLREALYKPARTIIFSSATLSVAGNFEFWLRRVGLRHIDLAAQQPEPSPHQQPDNDDPRPLDERIVVDTFPAPYDYRTRVLIGVCADAPLPTEESYADFLSRYVIDAVSISGGGALVLFTSYNLLRIVVDAARKPLDEQDIELLQQGDADRSQLLRRFIKNKKCVLCATDSFWEGVDIPGDSLRLVIITRLPFRVPTDPVAAARSEALEKAGANPFFDLALPEAVIRLRQGFGRLMRSRHDRGAVLISDSRVSSKSYGRLFLDSLPETRRSIGESRQTLIDLENFLYE